MVRKIALLFLILTASICCNARTARILAIGNSFSEDAIEQNLHEIAAAAGDTAIIGNLYIGGCELEKHFYNAIYDSPAYRYRKIDVNGKMTQTDKMTIKDALTDDKWDVVTLQQASHYSGLSDSYTPWITRLTAYIRTNTAYNPEIGFHQTWAYAANASHWAFDYYNHSQEDMYRHICSAVRQAINTAGITLVIPSGTAIQNGRTSALGDNLNRDGYHLDLKIGRFIAACTWYETLFGKDVTKNTYIPDGVSGTDTAIARRAAHAAVSAPWNVTEIQ